MRPLEAYLLMLAVPLLKHLKRLANYEHCFHHGKHILPQLTNYCLKFQEEYLNYLCRKTLFCFSLARHPCIFIFFKTFSRLSLLEKKNLDFFFPNNGIPLSIKYSANSSLQENVYFS